VDSENGEYERGLWWAIFNGGSRAEDISHLYRALELSPSNIHARADLAGSLLMLRDIKKAREYGEKALRLDPGYVLAQYLRII